jgi:hypothetical protein
MEEMSEELSDLRKQAKSSSLNQEQPAIRKPKINSIKAERVCVIITRNKNSSWVDDLDARERLNKCQRVFH